MRYAMALLALVTQTCLAENLQIVTPQGSFDLSLEQMKADLQTHLVTIEDPVYKTTKQFDAFLLADVLQLAKIDLSAKLDEIVFTAKDGYSPNTSFENLRKHRAFLAYQEHGTVESFGEVEQGKAMVSPAPFYVVWEEGKKLSHEVPWPYQLVKIEVVDTAKKFANVYPKNAKPGSSVMKGFTIFKDQCLKCHSINLQGGDIGPELNTPKNITEYWSAATLKAFIQKPSSFRAKSKMPDLNLPRESVNHLVNYLKHMKSQKVQP